MAAMTDDELAAKLTSGIRQASGYTEGKLAKERERVTKYYTGELPNRYTGSNSSYVSMDVYDAVENMKAQLLEVFSGNAQPVSFPPLHAEDVDAARDATDYVSYVVMQQNDGFKLMHDAIDDGLMYRAGIVKVWWEDKIENVEMEMAEANLTDLQAYLADHPEAEIKALSIKEDGVTIEKAEIALKVDKSQVRIEPVPLEEFGISSISVSIEKAALVYHRQLKSASDLIKEGYSKKLVESLQDQDESWIVTEPELLLRFDQTDDIVGMRDDAIGQEARRKILVHECYCELDMEGDGRAELWKVIIAGDVILDKERVSRKPFIEFVPLPRPHAFWGTNFAKLVVQTQIARTYLTRSIVDHALITNNPRYQVVRGALLNPRELMENRIGGVVNVLRADGVSALPQAALNPYVYQTMSMLDQDKEDLTGISSLSVGLNKDAISSQNSGAMVDQLITVSQIRQKICARQFANGFLTNLYRQVYELVVENEKQEKIIEICGEFRVLNPSTWPEREKLNVGFALGYGEQDKEAAKWKAIDESLASDPRLAGNYGPQQRYNVISKALTNLGIKDTQTYFLPPNKVPPPQPDPMQQAELAVKQADAAVKQANAQAAVEKLKLDQQVAAQNHEVEMAKLQLELLKLQSSIQQAKDALAHKVAVDAVEIQLEQQAAAAGKVTAVAEPTH